MTRSNVALYVAMSLLFAGGCGEDEGRPNGSFSGGQITSNPLDQTGSSGEGDKTSDGTQSGGSQTTPADETSEGNTTTGPEPGDTTTTEDPPDPSTTTGPVNTTDPPNPSTTTDEPPDPETTDGTTTDDPPDPPMKDPQPVGGNLYADCSGQNTCSDLCLELQDVNMVKIDGFCSSECLVVNDCQPAPQGSTAECLDAGGVSYCVLPCASIADCPTGMTCEEIELGGSYCW